MPPRPKRPNHTVSHSIDAMNRSGAGLAPSKRPKFDARNPQKLAPDAPETETDIFLEADEGAVGKRRVHRNAVELEGYDTDSTEDGFEATHKQWASEHTGKGKGKGKENMAEADGGNDDDDDDDMFGGDDDKPAQADPMRVKRNKKNVKFMDLEEIEGQEEEISSLAVSGKHNFPDIFKDERHDGSGSSDDDEEKLAEEGLDPEVGIGGRKKHAPKRDAFNMKSEMEEGRFDANGNFIRKAVEKDAIHDSWLQGISRNDMKKAREAMEKREEARREQMLKDDEILTSDVLSTLIVCLERGESILEALARVGTSKKKNINKNKNQWRKKRKMAASDGTNGQTVVDSQKGKEQEDPEETRRKEMVEKITEAANLLLTRDQPEVYDETRESLMRQYQRETGEPWVDRKPTEVEVEEVEE
jgi:CD2 antigen cytoplasmic tail-binding protein 2